MQTPQVVACHIDCDPSGHVDQLTRDRRSSGTQEIARYQSPQMTSKWHLICDGKDRGNQIIRGIFCILVLSITKLVVNSKWNDLSDRYNYQVLITSELIQGYVGIKYPCLFQK